MAIESLRTVNYKNLETRTLESVNIKIKFGLEDKIGLRRGIKEGKPIIEVVMPWGNVYKLGEYKTEKEQEKIFIEYLHNLLIENYFIRITGVSTAEIIKE